MEIFKNGGESFMNLADYKSVIITQIDQDKPVKDTIPSIKEHEHKKLSDVHKEGRKRDKAQFNKHYLNAE